MCESCGFPVDMLHNAYKQTQIVYNCPRCGHKLEKPVTIPGTQQESEGSPTRERKTLLD